MSLKVAPDASGAGAALVAHSSAQARRIPI